MSATTVFADSTPFSVDTQHDDMIHDSQFDYYGTKLATCSTDRTVKIVSVLFRYAYNMIYGATLFVLVSRP